MSSITSKPTRRQQVVITDGTFKINQNSETGNATRCRYSASLTANSGTKQPSIKWSIVIACLFLLFPGNHVQCDEDDLDSIKMNDMIANARELSTMPDLTEDSEHDSEHPDHVDGHGMFDDFETTSGLDNFETVSEEAVNRKVIVRHRKVYLVKDQQQSQIESMITPIQMTIPVKIGNLVPSPKPVYSYRKITGYDNSPEVKLVPVNTTVIKPAGVSDNQFLENLPTKTETATQRKAYSS